MKYSARKLIKSQADFFVFIILIEKLYLAQAATCIACANCLTDNTPDSVLI